LVLLRVCLLSARLEQNTRRNGVFGLPGTTLTRLGTGLTKLVRPGLTKLVRPGLTRLGTALTRFGTAVTKLVRPGLTNLVQAVPDLADSHLVRPSRTTLVRTVHNCRLTEFKSWQRLFIAGDLSIFEDSIPDQFESSEKERKRAKEQGEKKKEEGRGENRRIKLFSPPDLRSSSIMLLFISLIVSLDRSMTSE
jgi:hypothetical protein